MTESCLFCRIVRREIPAKVIHEDEHTVAFRDIDPKAPTHVLVIPKEHVPSLNEATDAAQVGRLMLVGAQIAKAEGIAAGSHARVLPRRPSRHHVTPVVMPVRCTPSTSGMKNACTGT